jgi:hypothetical protein
MQTFLSGQDIVLSFDLSLTGLTPTAVEVEVLDHEGAVLAARAPLVGWVAPATEASVTVVAVNNAVAVGSSVAARTVHVFVIGTGGVAGEALMSESYRLVLQDRLPIPEASFQTFAGAEMEALDMINLSGWAAASESDKISALMEARHRIAGMRFHYVPDDWQSRVMTTIDYSSLSDLTASDWSGVDPIFKRALRRAQVIEADAVIARGVNQDQQFQDQGVVSIVIGESSRTYARTRPASAVRPVCGRALSVLSRFLAPARIGRA